MVRSALSEVGLPQSAIPAALLLGVEWGFMQNWSAKLEYLYIAVAGSGANTDRLNTIRAGINYRF